MWSPALSFCSSSVASLLCSSARLSFLTPRTVRWKPLGVFGSCRPSGRSSCLPLDSKIGRKQLRTTNSCTSLADLNSLSNAAETPIVLFTETMKSPLLSRSSGLAVLLYERKGPSFTCVTKSMSRSCTSRPKPQVLNGSFGTDILTSMGGPGGSFLPASLTLNLSMALAPRRPAPFSRTTPLKPLSTNAELGKAASPRASDPRRPSSKAASSGPRS
mmetsp:Transcript_79385/g.246205  ORF Transcript_79385/g.246205 Transcript_79385/m.246205 type:complete len:216 (+) Transcript_79385:155-802(+)